jgi:PEP-CTERM motif
MVRTWKFARLAGAAAFFAFCLAPSPSQATSLSAVCLVSPGTTDCPSGTPTISGLTKGVDFSLNLFIDDAADVGDFYIDGMTWPAAALSLVSIVDGGFLGTCVSSTPCFQASNSVAGGVGPISFFDSDAPHSATGWGKLAILTFHPLLSGSASIAFTGSILVTDLDTFDTIESSVTGATVAIAPAAVPEPATVLLVGSGIAAALARRRRENRRRNR